jgi:hypothetical protein
LALLSISALVAFAVFPLLAQADSGEIQYEDAPPSVTGKNTPQTNPPARDPIGNAKTSTSPDSGGSEVEGETSPDGSDETEGSQAGGSSAGGNKPQGNPGDGSKSGVAVADASPGSKSTAAPASSQGDDDGSSPVVPIVIAVAVLAAISVAVMVARRRRQDDSGAPFSPEAS